MRTAHLIHGYLGTGKTSLAKQLEEGEGAVRFTHDEWMSRLYGDNPSAELFSVYYERVADLIESLWTRNLALGNDVVLDLNFWTRQQRERVRNLVAQLGGTQKLYAQRWLGKSGQRDKWILCLMAASMAANRSDYDETTPPKPHAGVQG